MYSNGRWLTPQKRLAILIRDEFKCLYCERNLRNEPPQNVTLDHLKPRCKGGSNESTNVITACGNCNYKRGTKSWKQFATLAAQRRINNASRRALNIELAKSIIAGNVSLDEGN